MNYNKKIKLTVEFVFVKIKFYSLNEGAGIRFEP